LATCRVPLLVAVFSLFIAGASLRGEDKAPPVHFRESVAIETNLTAQRQLELARVQFAEKHWNEAIELIRQVSANSGDSLVKLAPGRYLGVRLYSQLLSASMPADGLARFRQTVDGSARQAFEEAVAVHDEGALRTLLRNSFAASIGDLALLTRGRWAWESGDLTKARGCWQRILPLSRPVAPGGVPALLRFPDSRLDRAEILARLVLCRMIEGDRDQSAIERQAFRKHFPEARGRLGRGEGKLADRLDQIATESMTWSFPPRDAAMATFAVNPARNGVLPRAIDVGALRWAADMEADAYAPSPAVRFADNSDALSLFPVVEGDILLANTADQIFAWNLRTGNPAWPGGHNEGPAIYPAVIDKPPSIPATPLIGAPRYTMTVYEGHLFARMGTPITARAQLEFRESDSHLVCLDLRHGEGKLIWKVDAAAIDSSAAFEGSPLVVEGRAYVVARRGQPQMQTAVIALDSGTGRRLWDRTVSAAVANGQNDSLMTHQLLTLGDDALFLSTGSGAIAALEIEDGSPRWIVTYGTLNDESGTASRSVTGGPPCLFAQDLVVAAPNDSASMLALDARTGATVWRKELPGGVTHLLGSKDGVLIVAGRALWGLELTTGRVEWHVGFTDPGSFGYGRGVLAGDVIYWPTREEIFVVEQSTGSLRRRIPLLIRDGELGGNLLLAGQNLVVAEPRRIAVFGPYAGPRHLRGETYSFLRPTSQKTAMERRLGPKTGLSAIWPHR
jgi:outer membrane protein assembly factor BamB